MELKNKASLTFIIITILSCAGCQGKHDYSPKPHGYFRIIYPKKQYERYDADCPFTFIYPKYAVIEPDTKPNAKSCWLNMQFKQFNGTLHLSYEPITTKKVFDELTEDAHTFAFKHTVKATSIDQGIIHYADRKVYGIYYTIDGNAASSVQFFLTDSAKHYLRGALYFNTEPRLDSIQPVLNFVKKDVDTLIKTFMWKP
jgi:gliding motility-associated lipoprotein GldD